VRRLPRSDLLAPGLHPHRTPKLSPGSTAGVLVAVDGLTAGVLVVAAAGSTDGVLVGGSIAGVPEAGSIGGS
jgi:hypothetical protein